MLPSTYIEDIFVEFFHHAHVNGVNITAQDYSAASSFYTVIAVGQQLTQNQANFILKLMQKYQQMLKNVGFDYSVSLANPQWRTTFRVLDFSKKLFVEKDEAGAVWVCAKFPYQLKKEFDDEIDDTKTNLSSSWDSDRRLRKLYLYDTNLIQLYEFAIKHQFEIDDTFMIALGEVEEIWQTQEQITPLSYVNYGAVYLKNASASTVDWWLDRKTESMDSNLLLAKSMGYLYEARPKTVVEKIAATPTNSFWIKENLQLFSLYKSVGGRMAVILDRTGNTLSWLDQFVKDADTAAISREDIRVCFREHKDTDTGLNGWIKHNGVGGKVEDGKILIFETKPAKWLFKDEESVKLVVSNNLYPATNQLTKDWFSSHPCVIYLGDIKPSLQRGQTIVEL